VHLEQLERWQHDHVFNQDQKRSSESRTLLVVCITTVMMIVEVVGGLIYGSMALLADGLHMASHAAALSVSFAAYVISRRLAADRRFAFGVGKINTLAGFSSALMLLGFAIAMAVESTERLMNPVAIAFDSALIVAVVGLVVNGASAWVLAASPQQNLDEPGDAHDKHHHDHNLRSAHLHVLADALTSLLAIVALLAGKYFGANWLDPIMGIVGAVLVARWSYGLIRDTSGVLLDHQADGVIIEAIRRAVEGSSTDRITDLHVWAIGHGIYAADIAIVSHEPQEPGHYRARIPADAGVIHATIEVARCSPSQAAWFAINESNTQAAAHSESVSSAALSTGRSHHQMGSFPAYPAIPAGLARSAPR